MSGSDRQAPIGVYKAKEMIHDMLLQSGQKELLIAHIRHRTTQNGWTWTMRDKFMEYIIRRGANNVNVSHMISDLAPLGRELFPADLKRELSEAIFEVTKSMFTMDESVPQIADPDDIHAGPDKTFLYQSRDIKPDPGLGIGVEVPDSPPPSPQSSNSNSSTPSQSPGPIRVTTPPPMPRHSPGSATRQSPVSAAARSLSPQPLPPPPVLRPETGPSGKISAVIDDDEDEEEEEEEEQEDEEDDEDVRNNDDDDEDELMDV